MNAILKSDLPISNAEWHQRRLAATPRGVGVMADFFIEHAMNAEFWHIEGRRFIDFAGGIAVRNTGHCHPKVMAAISAGSNRCKEKVVSTSSRRRRSPGCANCVTNTASC